MKSVILYLRRQMCAMVNTLPTANATATTKVQHWTVPKRGRERLAVEVNVRQVAMSSWVRHEKGTRTVHFHSLSLSLSLSVSVCVLDSWAVRVIFQLGCSSACDLTYKQALKATFYSLHSVFCTHTHTYTRQWSVLFRSLSLSLSLSPSQVVS